MKRRKVYEEISGNGVGINNGIRHYGLFRGNSHRRNQRSICWTEAAPQQKQGKVRKHLHRQMGMWKPRSLRYPMYLQKAIRSIRRFCRLRMNFMIRPEGGINWLFILTVHMEIIRTVLRHARWGLWISHVWTVRPTGWKQEACCLRHIALTATNIGSHLRRVIYVRRCAGKSVKQWEALIS